MMANGSKSMDCPTRSWVLAGLAGLVIGIIMLLAGWSFIGALLLAILIAVVIGLFMSFVVCKGRAEDAVSSRPAPGSSAAPSAAAAPTAAASSAAATSAPAPSASAAADPAASVSAPTVAEVSDDPTTSDRPASVSAPSAMAAPQPAPVPVEKAAAPSEPAEQDSAPQAAAAEPVKGPTISPSAPLAGQDDLGSRKAAWKYEKSAEAEADSGPAEAASDTAPAPDAEQKESAPQAVAAEPVKGPVVKPSSPLAGQAELASRKGTWKYQQPVATGGVKLTAKPSPAQAPAAPSAADPAAGDAMVEESQPDLMDAPGSGGADNLQRINGVGPKMEETLNALGIWQFSQIARWGEKEIVWVDARMRFKGRIKRDDWVGQAKDLAEGK